jgi:hypothetical protein
MLDRQADKKYLHDVRFLDFVWQSQTLLQRGGREGFSEMPENVVADQSVVGQSESNFLDLPAIPGNEIGQETKYVMLDEARGAARQIFDA